MGVYTAGNGVASHGKIHQILSWENVLGFCTGAAILVGLLVFSRLGAAKEQGREDGPFSLDPAIFEAGTMLQAAIIRHEFQLVNRSDRIARILGVHATCSCTVVGGGLEGGVLEARKSITVPVEYHSGMRDGPAFGEITVYLESGGHRYQTSARLRALVLTEFTVEPKFLDFGALKPGEEAVRVLCLVPKHAKALAITGCHVAHPSFRAAMPVQETGVSSNGPPQVSVKFIAPTENHRQTITAFLGLTTSNDRVPTLRVGMRAQVIPDVEALPAVIVLNARSAEQASFVTVRTFCRSRTLRILTVKEGRARLDPVGGETDGAGAWGLTHRYQLCGETLSTAEGIVVEMEIIGATERPEVRSVAIQVKNLENQN